MSSISESKMKATSSNTCTNFIITKIFPGFNLSGGNIMLAINCLFFRVHKRAPFGSVMFLSCSNNSKVYMWFLYRMVQPAYSGMTFGRVIFGVRLIQSFFLSARISSVSHPSPTISGFVSLTLITRSPCSILGAFLDALESQPVTS